MLMIFFFVNNIKDYDFNRFNIQNTLRRDFTFKQSICRCLNGHKKNFGLKGVYMSSCNARCLDDKNTTKVCFFLFILF